MTEDSKKKLEDGASDIRSQKEAGSPPALLEAQRPVGAKAGGSGEGKGEPQPLKKDLVRAKNSLAIASLRLERKGRSRVVAWFCWF
jgi:hypothetical protein